MDCMKCGSVMVPREARKRRNGKRYRPYDCEQCNYRELKDLADDEHLPAKPRSGRAFSNADQIYSIIRSELSNSEEAKRWQEQGIKCSKEMVRLIRAGKAYQDLLPYGHVPKDAAGPRCDRCQHWQGDHCGLGFPDPLEEGLFFARDCAAWVEGA